MNSRPGGALVGWRATESIGQVHKYCQRAGKVWGADLRSNSAARRRIASAVASIRLASSASCMALMRSSIGILTLSLVISAATEAM